MTLLRYLQGNVSYRYALKEGQTYSVVAIYAPFGLDTLRFESYEVNITYEK